MAAGTERALTNAWQGALAGGGDPASSPLYVFGPFLTLLAGAGVASVTFGTSIWLAVLTIVVVSLLYRLVMRWIVDGSGGTGLAEEELGSWAAKITAALTCIEYTLTFLVSISALVTFTADRLGLSGSLFGVSAKSLLAVGASFVCAFLVGRGPRVVSRVFGPATAAVLALLWVMIGAVVVKRGVHVAPFHLGAFRGRYLGFTLGGFVRILALMTGIEVFANLVASYSGTPAQRSKKAFTSLALVMGSTAITMLIVGPAILALADPADPDVSVFTQTMDALLPRPLSWAGTLVSVLVLLSAAAASAVGIENLFLGLSVRHYAPAAFAVQNRSGVADRPVWAEAIVAALLFVVLGTDESTYLAIYAAGVFVLLSMTAVAAVLRLSRRRRAGVSVGVATFGAVILAALFTSLATAVLFYERLGDGLWIYGLLVPGLFVAFAVVRRLRGDPGALAERMGRLVSSRGVGSADVFGSGVGPGADEVAAMVAHLEGDDPGPRSLPSTLVYRGEPLDVSPWRVCVPLDGSAYAEGALPYVVALAGQREVELVLLHIDPTGADGDVTGYLDLIAAWASPHVGAVSCHTVAGRPVEELLSYIDLNDIQVVVLSSHGRTGIRRAIAGSVTNGLVAGSTRSTVVVRSAADLHRP